MKADIVFIQQFPVPYFGILAMDAYLKRSGFRAEVLIDGLEDDLVVAIKRLDPHLIGFSIFSSEHLWLKKVSGLVHKAFPHIPLVAGGVHAKIYPQEILNDTECTLICQGDGEETIVDLLSLVKNFGPEAYRSCAGIMYKDATKMIHQNAPKTSTVVSDPVIEDRGIYFNRYPVMKKDEFVFFISSRGCPYACTFCYNSYLRDIHGTQSSYIRQKNPEVLLEEIRRLRSHCDIKIISFVDDMFTFNVDWLRKFLELYRTHFQIPFGCNTRANQINEETALLLAQAGCRFASFGIETGNEEIRREILNKQISNAEIVRAGKLLSDQGIIVRSSNMFCLPGETLQDAFSTIELNIQSHVQSASSMLLLPYPKTKIAAYCLHNHYLEKEIQLEDLPHITQKVSILFLPDKRKIMNVHYLTYWFVRYPFLFRLARGIVHCAWLNPVFYLVFLFGFFVRNKNEAGLSWGKALCFAWRKRALIIKRK